MNRAVRLIAWCGLGGTALALFYPERRRQAFIIGAYIGYVACHAIELIQQLDDARQVRDFIPRVPWPPPPDPVRPPPAAPRPEPEPEKKRPDRFELVELD